jgi:phage N-6-adenine-methyltransferase
MKGGPKTKPKPLSKDPTIARIKSNQERRTPRWLFEYLDTQFGPFELDAAATLKDETRFNALCPKAYDSETNGLSPTSFWCSKTFCNPPFKYMKLWVFKALLECEQRGCFTCMLAPIGGSQDWFQQIARQYTILYPDMRISYDDEFGNNTGNKGDEEAGGANRDTCILLIGPGFKNPHYASGQFNSHILRLKTVKRKLAADTWAERVPGKRSRSRKVVSA